MTPTHLVDHLKGYRRVSGASEVGRRLREHVHSPVRCHGLGRAFLSSNAAPISFTQPSRSASSRCSQNRRTAQPSEMSVVLTLVSRALLRVIFSSQKARLATGGFPPQVGQPCQKHPSTNTAILGLTNAKSGEPKIERFRTLYPRKPAPARAPRIRRSVVLFSEPRMAAMTLDRVSGLRRSALNGASSDDIDTRILPRGILRADS